MSCDPNSRGVKRKIETVEGDSYVSSNEQPLFPPVDHDSRRIRLDASSFECTLDLGSLPSSVAVNTSTPVCNDNLKPMSITSSLSFDSMSDEDDSEYDDDSPNEYSKDDDDESVCNHANEDSAGGVASAESESGYDERASSNSSSTSDSTSTTSDPDFAPVVAVSVADSFPVPSLSADKLATYSSQGDLSSVSSHTFCSQTQSAEATSPSRNSLSGVSTSDSSFCSYKANLVNSQAASQQQPHPQSSYSPNRQTSRANTYLRQRQQIFNLSMYKLSRFRQSSDPSLHRSVMICNTLRMLEKELEREGVKINFGPNGVSFISPVHTADLDFLPILQPPSQPNMAATPTATPSDCLPMSDSSYEGGSSPMRADQPEQYDYTVHCDSNTTSADSCSEYDKYFAVDSSSASGRVTPFVKSFASNDYPSRVIEPNMNSAFWGNGEEQMSDRLTSLNWSSMLTFNSSSTPSTEVAVSDANTRHLSQSPSSETLSNGSLMPYSTEPSQSSLLTANSSAVLSTTTSSSSSSPSSLSPNVATFATLLPPASTLTLSSASMEHSSSLVSSAVSSNSSSYQYSSSNVTSSSYYPTTNSAQSMYTAIPSHSMSSQQSCGVSSSVNTSGSSITSTAAATNGVCSGLLTTSSYMNSYLSISTTSDEIFSDIDPSLYDFDIFSPLSPPSITNKAVSNLSTDELIRNISPSDSHDMSNGSSSTTLFSLNHYQVNGYSGQNYTSPSYFSTSCSPSPATSGPSLSSSVNSQLMVSPSTNNNTPSSAATLANCGSSSSGTAIHLHTASGRYYKTPEERDQQTITTIKCHN